MGLVVLKNGHGMNSLMAIAQEISSEYAGEQLGTQYEMSVDVQAPATIVKASLYLANRYLSQKGVKPWPGHASVASVNGVTVLFQWRK